MRTWWIALGLIACGGGSGGGSGGPPLNVVSTSPTDGASAVAVGEQLIVTFDQALAADTAAGSITLDDGSGTLDGVVSVDGTALTFDPDGALRFNVTYTATVGTALRSVEDGALEAPFVWSFTVEADLALQAFVTSTQGTEVFSTWPEAGGTTGLLAADAICQARADAAGLEGTFVAWVSDDVEDAICRLVGLPGKEGGNACGATTLPAAGPWVRTDGSVVSASATELVGITRGDVRVPIVLDELGAVRSTAVWTNTTRLGAFDGGLVHGASAGTTNAWTDFDSSADEGDLAALYCFEVGSGPAVPDEPVAGKLMFLTSDNGNGNMGAHPRANGATGLAAADEVCRSHATDAGFADPTKFVAWMSDSTITAPERVTGNGPWFRPDGVLVAATKAALTSGRLHTSPNERDDNIYVPWSRTIGNAVWTGTNADGSVGTSLCTDWTSTADSGQLGRPAITDDRWTSETVVSCALGAPIYCLQN